MHTVFNSSYGKIEKANNGFKIPDVFRQTNADVNVGRVSLRYLQVVFV